MLHILHAVANSLDEAVLYCCLSDLYRMKVRHQYRIKVSIRHVHISSSSPHYLLFTNVSHMCDDANRARR